ncbi:MAG: sulfatase [Deltaproteobacteria bacterium]|nr:sulfatase [Deltaproteobacteria bacterium]
MRATRTERTSPRAQLLARAAVVALSALSLGVAWRAGGGAEGASAPPRAGAPTTAASLASAPTGPASVGPQVTSPAGGPTGSEGYEVAARLTEITARAKIDAPWTQEGLHVLSAHWRKMKPPWFSVAPAAAKHVTSLALRTSTIETQWAQPTGGGKAWTPDAKIWNLNEGSYDQRDALVGEAPSTFSFEVAVPSGARLTFAEGTVNAIRDAIVFVVTVVDASGKKHELRRKRLSPAEARRWREATCDLSAFAGQSVQLQLSAEPAEATDEEIAAAERERHDARAEQRRAAADAGAREREQGGDDTGAQAASPTSKSDDILSAPGPGVVVWGNPMLLAKGTPRVPYNVLWIVVDALRPDVIASFHDDAEDAAKQKAEHPPLEALLPKVPGLMPVMDGLAKKGVRFTQAYSAGAWTRPGTLAMLSGARSTELGLDTERWAPWPSEVTRFYASDPPLLPLLLRRRGVTVHGFVNNYFMVGYAPVGVEMGFEHVTDHRFRTRDTLEITRDAATFIASRASDRFFAFVNYNSPHEPYEPPAQFVARVPAPPEGPKDEIPRLYMAEAAKDDEAIGVLLRALDDAKIRDRTIIVVTADHGETLSSAHGGISGLDRMPVRYHHAASNYEETTRVPILVVAPGLLPENVEVKERVRNVDLAPTVMELLGIEASPRMSGRSMVALAKGQKERDERVVVSEGRGTRAILFGRHRLLVREGAARSTTYAGKTVTKSEELFDLVDDPGERVDLAASKPDVVAEMRARLDAALKNVPVAGSAAASSGPGADPAGKPPAVQLRFVANARPRRVSGTLVVGDAKVKPRSVTVDAVDLGRETFHVDGGRVELAFVTSVSTTVGFDVRIDPPAAPIAWDLYLDDKPWPEEAVFAGPFGLLAPTLRRGLATDEARAAADARVMPPIDVRRDFGLFVIRERRGPAGEEEPRGDDGEGAEEMQRLLREWGYAHGPKGGGK